MTGNANMRLQLTITSNACTVGLSATLSSSVSYILRYFQYNLLTKTPPTS